MRTATVGELDAGRRSLRGALDRLDAVVVPTLEVAERTDWRTFRDLNTQRALAAFESEEDGRP
jgi:molybdopterin-guanine dinucleotide biosynthesis protein A